MVGGGSIPKPGEISLAHKGVLFLDEFSQFQSSIIECLRQPMEEGFITITRSRASVRLPCDFTLVACSNPCPCGFLGDRKIRCVCKPPDINRYKKKLSGPILDRIDLFVRVWSPNLEYTSESNEFLQTREKISRVIKRRVELVRDVQFNRFKVDGVTLNAKMNNNLVKKYCKLSSSCGDLLDSAVHRFNLSPRSVFKVIKVARTIADMDGAGEITPAHLAESVQYKAI
jgi:magnesium chelatase family protein